MKKIYILPFLLIGLSVLSQNKQIIYGFDDIPESIMVNPANFMKQDIHVGIPFLSQFYFHFGSTGVSAYDVFKEGNTNINSTIGQVINSMKNTDFFTINQQLDILNVGYRNKKDVYFSGGIYQEFDFIFYFPKDWATLAWEGNKDFLGKKFQFEDISIAAEMFSVFHFGAQKKFSKKLTLGGRFKLYSSIAQASSTGNSGYFVTETEEGSPNIYRHKIVNANVKAQTAGIQSFEDVNSGGEIVNKVIGKALLGGNLGVGVDIGANYEFNRNWSASVSLLDLGIVFYNKDVESYESKGNHIVDGIGILFPPLSDGDSTIEYYNNIEDDFEEDIPLDTITNPYTKMRPIKLNAAVSYGFGRKKDAPVCDCLSKNKGEDWREKLGLQLYGIKRPKRPQFAVTAFYYRQLTNAIAAKLTYTIDPYTTTNVGLGLSTNFWWGHFYLAADNLLNTTNLAKSKSVSLQLGFNIKIDKEQ